MLYKLGWFGKRMAASRRAIDKGASDRAYVWDTLACNLEASGRDARVLEAFEKAITLREDDVEITWNVLAELYEPTRRKDKAEEVRQKMRTHEKPNH